MFKLIVAFFTDPEVFKESIYRLVEYVKLRPMLIARIASAIGAVATHRGWVPTGFDGGGDLIAGFLAILAAALPSTPAAVVKEVEAIKKTETVAAELPKVLPTEPPSSS